MHTQAQSCGAGRRLTYKNMQRHDSCIMKNSWSTAHTQINRDAQRFEGHLEENSSHTQISGGTQTGLRLNEGHGLHERRQGHAHKPRHAGWWYIHRHTGQTQHLLDTHIFVFTCEAWAIQLVHCHDHSHNIFAIHDWCGQNVLGHIVGELISEWAEVGTLQREEGGYCWGLRCGPLRSSHWG